MHHYPFHIGDYAIHTRHLTPMQDLAYRRMLDLYYLHERPFNGRSTDVARLIALSDHEADVDVVLREFFVEDGGAWHNKRADKEIEAYDAKLDAAIKAGKASGKARKARSNDRSTTVQPTFNDRSTTVEPTKNLEPVPSNQEPSLVQTPRGARSVSPEEKAAKEQRDAQIEAWFDEFWTAYDKRVGRPAAIKAFKRIKDLDLVMPSLLEAAAIYRAATPDKQYRKHPATWLNQEGWCDEVVEPAKPTLPFAKPIPHIQNLALGTPSCNCPECVAYRAKRTKQA